MPTVDVHDDLEPLETYRVTAPEEETAVNVQLTGITDDAAYGIEQVTGRRVVFEPLDWYIEHAEFHRESS